MYTRYMKYIFTIVCLLVLSGCTTADLETAIEIWEEFSPEVAGVETGHHKVIRVVDGDTVVIDYFGEETTLRLIGVDTPETKHPNKDVECFGPEASAFMEELLSDRSIEIELDESQGSHDRYNRLLVYIWLDGVNINELLIGEGYAFEYTYNLPYKYQDEFKQAQSDARGSQRGLWGANCTDS